MSSCLLAACTFESAGTSTNSNANTLGMGDASAEAGDTGENTTGATQDPDPSATGTDPATENGDEESTEGNESSGAAVDSGSESGGESESGEAGESTTGEPFDPGEYGPCDLGDCGPDFSCVEWQQGGASFHVCAQICGGPGIPPSNCPEGPLGEDGQRSPVSCNGFLGENSQCIIPCWNLACPGDMSCMSTSTPPFCAWKIP